MAWSITIRQGGAVGDPTVDYTSQIPIFDIGDGQTTPQIRMGMQCDNGSASISTIIIDDDLGEIPRADGTKSIAGHNYVLYKDNVGGTDYWLSVGHVAPKDIGRNEDNPIGNARQFDVQIMDANAAIDGIVLTADVSRPAETGWARFSWLASTYLNGSPRLTTVMTFSATHLAPNTNTVSMPAKDYQAGIHLSEIIQDCADTEAKFWGATIHHTGGSHVCLEYILPTDHTTFACAAKISDVPADHVLDSTTVPVLPPSWEQGAATEENSNELISALVLRYGNEDRFVYVADTAQIAAYDYWADTYYDNTSVTETQALAKANSILFERKYEHVTHQVSLSVKRTQIHLFSAGMSIQIKSAAAMGGQYLGTYQTRRIAECIFEPASAPANAPEWYWVHLKLDRVMRRGGSGSRAITTTPKPAPQCDTGTGLTRIVENNDAKWPGTYPYTFGDCSAVEHNVGASGGNAQYFAVSASTSYNLNLIIDANRHAYTLATYYYDADPSMGPANLLGSDSFPFGVIGTDNGIECVIRTPSFTTPVGTTHLRIAFQGKLGGWRYEATIDEVANPPDNDPDCIDYGDSPHDSPYYPPSDYFEDRLDLIDDVLDEIGAARPPYDYVVAASDTSTAMQAIADAVCDGTADQTEINAAITAAVTANRPYSILCLPGTYNLSGSVDFTGLTSMGAKWVVFEASGTTWKASANLTTMVKLDPGAGGQIITCADIRLGRLDGNKASFTVTQLVNIARFNDNILRIADVDGATGIGVKVAQAGITDYPCGNNKIDIEIIHNCDGTAFIVTGTTANVYGFQGNTVHIGEIIACDNGIILGSAVNQNASHNIFITGPIEHNDNYGIYDYCGGNTFIVANTNNNTLGSLGAPTGVTLRSSYMGGFEEAMDAAVIDQHYVQNFGAWQGITEFVQRASAPATPAAGRLRIYSKTDDKLYYKTDGGTEVEVGAAGGGGAPTTADYLVGTAQAGLSAEIVVGATPGGELGGTWASPTVDATHSGSAHHAQHIVRKNSGGSDFTRGRLNLIEGTNVTLTVADDAGNDEVDVTIAATATGSGVSTFDLDTAGGSTTSTTLVDTNMALAVAASTSYAFRAVIFFFTSVNTNGLRLAVNGPTGATGRWGIIIPTAASGQAVAMGNAQITALNTAILATTSGPGVSGVMAIVEGTMTVAGTAGNLTIQYASETGGAVSIEPGSYLQLTQM